MIQSARILILVVSASPSLLYAGQAPSTLTSSSISGEEVYKVVALIVFLALFFVVVILRDKNDAKKTSIDKPRKSSINKRYFLSGRKG